MDDLYITEKLAFRLKMLDDLDDGLLTAVALDTLIDDEEFDLSKFKDFMAELSPDQHNTAEEFIDCVEKRLKERSRWSGASAKVEKIASESQSMTGTVKWFNDAKGFGFVSADQGGAEVFAHFSALQSAKFKTLRAGQHVKFDLKREDDGLLLAYGLKLDE